MKKTTKVKTQNIEDIINFLEASIAEKFGDGSKEMLAFSRISNLAFRYSELCKWRYSRSDK